MSPKSFDPNEAATENSGIFGLPSGEAESSLIFVPIPWEATTSYGGGTAFGPSAIFKASKQVDLFDLDVLKPYEAGLHMLPESSEVRDWNERAKGADPKTVNQLGEKLNQFVYSETKRLLEKDKIVGIVGGDHSVPFGALKAIAERQPEFGILHFDAHMDMRQAFEGYTWSHASIMHNVFEQIPRVTKIVQVGIRDICEEEANYALSLKNRIQTFYDRDLSQRMLDGVTWGSIAKEIVASLPNYVWISFDIDGLDPRLCPNTGTPVPGGIDFHQANYIFSTLVKSGRRIIGFDLNEVAPDPSGKNEWDANVGARLLYKLSAWTLASQSKAKLQII